MIGHDRVEEAVDSRVGGRGGRHRIRDREAVSTRCSSHSALNVGGDIALGTGAKKRGWRPLFFYYTVVVCGWGRGNENRGKGASSLDQFDQLCVVSFDPLIPKGTMECRGEGQWLAKRVEIEDRGRAMRDNGGKRSGLEPSRRVGTLGGEREAVVGRGLVGRRREQAAKRHGRRMRIGWRNRSCVGCGRNGKRWGKGQSTRCWRQVWCGESTRCWRQVLETGATTDRGWGLKLRGWG